MATSLLFMFLWPTNSWPNCKGGREILSVQTKKKQVCWTYRKTMTAGDQMRDRHYSLLKITSPVDNWACVPIGKQFSMGIVLSAENLTALWAIFLWGSYRSLEDGKSISLQSWRHISLMSRIKKIMSPPGAKVRHIFLHPFKDWSSLCSGLLMGKGKLSTGCPALSHGTRWARGTCADLKLMLLALLRVIKSLISTQAFCVSWKQPSNLYQANLSAFQ